LLPKQFFLNALPSRTGVNSDPIVSVNDAFVRTAGSAITDQRDE